MSSISKGGIYRCYRRKAHGKLRDRRVPPVLRVILCCPSGYALRFRDSLAIVPKSCVYWRTVNVSYVKYDTACTFSTCVVSTDRISSTYLAVNCRIACPSLFKAKAQILASSWVHSPVDHWLQTLRSQMVVLLIHIIFFTWFSIFVTSKLACFIDTPSSFIPLEWIPKVTYRETRISGKDEYRFWEARHYIQCSSGNICNKHGAYPLDLFEWTCILWFEQRYFNFGLTNPRLQNLTSW